MEIPHIYAGDGKMIYIISAKNAAVLKRSLGLSNKKSWIKLLPQLPEEYKLHSGDLVYFDISVIGTSECKKLIRQFRKNGNFFGIIDPKGIAADPALFFFNGASDYIGQALVKKGLEKKRFAEALSRACEKTGGPGKKERSGRTGGTGKSSQKKNQKLVLGKFPGWKSLRPGSTGFFFFLFLSLSGKSNLLSMLGEAAFISLKNKLRDVLKKNFREANALIWMEAEGNSLLLIPPKLSNGRAAVKTALKMILNSKLICIEKLGLLIPAEFTFALHYGQTIYQAPGQTGEVISESVNYIFHLGTKKAQYGRLTISEDVPDEAVPEGLSDLFVPSGIFEGMQTSKSRRFI